MAFGAFVHERGLDIDRSLADYDGVGDGRYAELSLRHLLSMSSGIEWADMRRGMVDYKKMIAGDWLAYVRSKPVDPARVGTFNYCDGNSVLLSALVSRYEGVSLASYAERVLFRKLGIEDYDWKERDGLTLGCTGLHMRSGDMVKLGLLMLNRGEAGGERLIPAAWVDESTRRQSEGHPAWFGHYGLHWWVSDARHNGIVDLYFALGAHGQFLIVAPERRLVACIRKKVGALADSGLPLRFFLDRVLPAVG